MRSQSDISAEAHNAAVAEKQKAEVANTVFVESSTPEHEQSPNFIVFIPNINGQKIRLPASNKRVALSKRNTNRYYDRFSDGEKRPGLKMPDQYVVSVGILDRDKVHRNIDPQGDDISYDFLFSILHHLGYDPLAPLRRKEFQDNWERRLGNALIGELNKNSASESSIRRVLSKIGETIKGICQDYIYGGDKPQLEKSTLYYRQYKEEEFDAPYPGDSGIDEPLCESGQLANAISVHVEAYTSRKGFLYFQHKRGEIIRLERERARRKKEREAERQERKREKDERKAEERRIKQEEKEAEKARKAEAKRLAAIERKKSPDQIWKDEYRKASRLKKAEMMADKEAKKRDELQRKYNLASEHYEQSLIQFERGKISAEELRNIHNSATELYKLYDKQYEEAAKRELEFGELYARYEAGDKSLAKAEPLPDAQPKPRKQSRPSSKKQTEQNIGSSAKPEPAPSITSQKPIAKPKREKKKVHIWEKYGYRQGEWQQAEEMFWHFDRLLYTSESQAERENASKMRMKIIELLVKKKKGYASVKKFMESRGKWVPLENRYETE